MVVVPVVVVVIVSVLAVGVVVEVHTPHMTGHVVRTKDARSSALSLTFFDVHSDTVSTVPHTLLSLTP